MAISQRPQSSLASPCRPYLIGHNKANQGKLIGTEQYDPDLMTALQEIKQLKRQLKVAEEEREILKKATAYFAKHS